MSQATQTPVVTSENSYTVHDTPLRLLMTEAEFEQFTDGEFNRKAEWVDGEVIVPMATSIKHAQIVRFLLTLIYLFCLRRKLGEVLGENAQVRFAELKRRRTPDIMFVAHERRHLFRETFFDGAPDLVVEIVSPDSVARDWREKYLDYQEAGVREYWVIDPLSEQVEAYALNAQNQYERIKEQEGKIASRVLSGFTLKPAWLWQDDLPNPIDVLTEFDAA